MLSAGQRLKMRATHDSTYSGPGRELSGETSKTPFCCSLVSFSKLLQQLGPRFKSKVNADE
jgi:hypothetical protein